MTTAQAILDSLKRTAPACVVCRGASGHPAIVGDGEPVCYPCILELGRIAGDPTSADPERLVDLALAHADVVEVRPCPVHVGGCWAWIGWPA